MTDDVSAWTELCDGIVTVAEPVVRVKEERREWRGEERERETVCMCTCMQM